ncbi:MAG: Putative periplasmic ATP /GTP-binding protein [uncultured Sulfurovum sp.]|uniref:Periplasmic ATP /GTP-binding protein n=1 Tax=uncultured Sulfurovum sp. TaxID=269237 RepID=A0A6S6SJD9_9BACT|nr:MAG: Putative periplasmic ATP /GTP-binding protein [uncultured Sulfurovum sp.]
MKNKSAFTMIELVFVIVVLGILASLAMGRMDRDLQQEASETILSHIRLAQQLALRDNKHRSDHNVEWQKAYWKIEFRQCLNGDWSYRVGSDIGLSGGSNPLAEIESAINPVDGKYLWADDCDDLQSTQSPSVHLSKKFGISDLNPTGGCNQNVSFDYLGRPHRSVDYVGADFSNIMTEDCNLTFTLSTDQNDDGNVDSFTITIKEETGHAFIVGQESL